jgi:hypothetical protein
MQRESGLAIEFAPEEFGHHLLRDGVVEAREGRVIDSARVSDFALLAGFRLASDLDFPLGILRPLRLDPGINAD